MNTSKRVSDPSHQVNRRQFLATTGAAAVTCSMLSPQIARAQSGPPKIKLGLIGCGGRGSWIANLFKAHGGFDVHAAADYFQDRLDRVGNMFGIPSNRLFTKLSGYKKLLESGVDAVAIETPPYFHPEQAAASVQAGKHVYVAKPIAVDVPGCLSIEESGRLAGRNKLCYLVDFQTRADRFYLEALKRVHQGAIGDFAFGESTYHAGNPFGGVMGLLEKDPKNPEHILRAWGLSREYSGDIITEQNIHTLDVMSWIMSQAPVSATGTGGHNVRTDKGTCWDHFALLYQYPNNVGVTFSSRQFNGHDSKPEGIRNRMFGSQGVLETQYGGQVIIRGKNFYRGGSSPGIYKEGAVNNIAAFHKNITEGNYKNETVAPSVRSNLATVLGRTAAYEKRAVTWDELLKCTDRMDPDMKGLKS